MIRNGFGKTESQPDGEAGGFDNFELRLGDLMRGERATMGKSLLDVQRELRIKAAYIAAIENCDPAAFDTPGFIAGYVRSYARYLNLDPDWAFETFCTESGFATAHGMSDEASVAAPVAKTSRATAEKDIFTSSRTPFIPAQEAMFAQVEPRAIGSILILTALICGLGYGGWTVLQEVQRVQLAPVEAAPVVVADIDPLAGASAEADDTTTPEIASFEAPTTDALDRLYRPQALETPVLVARDAPIATLDPRSIGALVPSFGGPAGDATETVVADAGTPEGLESAVQVTENPRPGVQLVAVRPSWVRVRSADGSVIYEAIMNSGDTFDVPQTEDPATLRIGEAGAVYFAVNGTHYGPVGPRGAVRSNVPLSAESLSTTYAQADIVADSDLCEVVVASLDDATFTCD